MSESRQVHIRRGPLNTHLPTKVANNSIRIIGSVLDQSGRNPLGLADREEQDELMEMILGMDKEDRDFRSRVENYLKDIRIKIPTSGKVIDISQRDDGTPKNPEEYFIFKWMKGHPQVADSKEEMESDHIKEFYIHDPVAAVSKENEKVQLKKRAYKALMEIDEKPAVMGHIVRLITNRNPDNMGAELMENVLSQQIEINPQQFLRYAEDKNLEIRSTIEELVEENILRKSGNSYIYMDEVIGETIDDAVAFFKSDRNSSLVLDLKEKLKLKKQ